MQANWKGSYGRYKMTAYTHYEGDICGNASSDDYKLYYPLDDEGQHTVLVILDIN